MEEDEKEREEKKRKKGEKRKRGREGKERKKREADTHIVIEFHFFPTPWGRREESKGLSTRNGESNKGKGKGSGTKGPTKLEHVYSIVILI